MRRFGIAALVAGWFFASIALGQDAKPSAEPGGTLLTLDQAVAIALEKNLQIASAELGSDAAKWEFYRSISLWLPKADFYSTYYRLDPDSVDRANKPSQALIDLEKKLGVSLGRQNLLTADNYGSNFTVVQPIINGGAEVGNILAAQAGQRDKRALWRDTVLQTILNVKTAYYSAVKARDLWKTATDSKALAAESLRLYQTQFEVGQAAKADLLLWEAQYANAEGAEIAAENAYRVAVLALSNLLGVEVTTAYVLPEDAGAKNVATYDAWYRGAALDREDGGAVDEAVRKHPAFERTLAAIDAAKGSKALAWSVILPKLNFNWVYSWATDHTIALDGDKSWTATFTLDLPLFRSGGGTFGIIEARKQYRQALLASKDAERGLVQRALSARLSIRSAYLRVHAADKEIASAQENLEVVRTRAKLGEATNLELLNAQLTYVTARSDFATAAADFETARAQWEYLLVQDQKK